MSAYRNRHRDRVNGELLDTPDRPKADKRMNVRRVKMKQILEVVESVLKEVFEEYKIGNDDECDCKPDMNMVEQVALQEGMTTQQILSLCSAINRSSKGTYGK